MTSQKSVSVQKTRQRSEVSRGRIWENGRPYWAKGISLSGYSSPPAARQKMEALFQVHPPWIAPEAIQDTHAERPTAHMRLRTKHAILLFTEILLSSHSSNY